VTTYTYQIKRALVDGILWLPTTIYWSRVTHKKAARKSCHGVTDRKIHAGFRAEPSKLCLERIWAELFSYSVLAIKIDWMWKLTTQVYVKQNPATRMTSAVYSMTWYFRYQTASCECLQGRQNEDRQEIAIKVACYLLTDDING